MKMLLTGFNPFGSVSQNPSQNVVEKLRAGGTQWPDVEIEYEVLDTSYAVAEKRIRELISSNLPDLVVMLGVASDRKSISLERFALNVDDCAAADNWGEVRCGGEIVAGGPSAYGTGIALEACCQGLRQRGLAVGVSNHAGTFVCNHLYCCAAHQMQMLGREGQCIFIHLPMPLGMGTSDSPSSLTLEALVDAVSACIDELLRTLKR